MPEPDFTRQDEDMAAGEFAAEEAADHYDFGNWPEVVGLVATVLLVWLILGVTG